MAELFSFLTSYYFDVIETQPLPHFLSSGKYNVLSQQGHFVYGVADIWGTEAGRTRNTVLKGDDEGRVGTSGVKKSSTAHHSPLRITSVTRNPSCKGSESRGRLFCFFCLSPALSLNVIKKTLKKEYCVDF